MRGETESEITAAQDQVLRTKHNKKKLQTKAESKYRLCQQLDETAEHMITACPTLAQE